jgi:hypothetical protein
VPSANNAGFDQNRPPQFEQGSETDVLAQWIYRELSALTISMIDLAAVELRTITQAPPKPREGMVVFADGTAWNPGSGKGFYGYKSGAWVHIA